MDAIRSGHGCTECEAFLANYRWTAERYAQLSRELFDTASPDAFRTPEFQRLKADTEAARDECALAKAAMRIHNDTIRRLEHLGEAELRSPFESRRTWKQSA